MVEDNEKSDEMKEGEEESFAELLEGSLVKSVQFTTGQKLEARIVKISAEWVFLDLGGKSEGYLDRKELLDDEGNLSAKEGDTITAYFLSGDAGELRFTTRITGGEAGRYHLEEAWRSGIPVEGLVEKEIKGGFEVRIAGGLRGFCPHSQVGLQHSGNPHDLIGQHLAFRITQYAERGRNIILSHRAVFEEERRTAERGTERLADGRNEGDGDGRLHPRFWRFRKDRQPGRAHTHLGNRLGPGRRTSTNGLKSAGKSR